MLLKTETLFKICPVCKHSWFVKHHMVLMGRDWLEEDFETAFQKHLISHVLMRDIKIDTQAYVYGGSLNEA